MLQSLYKAGNIAFIGRTSPKIFAPSVILQFNRYFSDESHADFQPQYKSQPESDVTKVIEEDIRDNSVFIYMKGHPEVPMCGFSRNACMVLNAYGVEYGHRNVLEDSEVREGIKSFTGWPTIPQIFVDGEFLGGFDTIFEMHHEGV
eukprot:TRINITY_DN4188_c0_g2_i2.p3 TRINITY_DN4188_c0_g2~~TRINITY_DN4188_c0_g2_i2.p3  ORF type:complete len:146 (-),score=10.88 TRINITY_DN4188_c0_g2_i2:79-516(-)